MTAKGMTLAWVVVKDFEEGVKFYTDVLGLKLTSKTPEYKWAELQGEDGAKVGVTEHSEMSPVSAGGNAVLTYTVENIEKSVQSLKAKDVEMVGEMQVIPEHVKLQLFKDNDGNYGQLAELLEAK
jgi:lactoylglutathione lyase